MKLVDERTAEMKCSVCGAVHGARRKDGLHYPPESLLCILGCRLEDMTDTMCPRITAIIFLLRFSGGINSLPALQVIA